MGPLKIGPLAVDPPVVLAPMAGVTNPAFRALCRTYGAGLYVSEMVTARALVEGNERTLAMVVAPESSGLPPEPVRSVQLYGTDPTTMAAAVGRLVGEVGVDHIDINLGCPAPKVTRKGGGAALPVHHVLTRRVIRAAVRAAGAVPVTVKMRMGTDAAHRTDVATATAAAEEGVAAVALHARTAEQHYAGAAQWDAIAELKQAVSGVPVLGNGDIWEAADALAMVATTGCDGVVVGRGCLGRPWLFADLADAFAGRPVAEPPTLGVVAAVMARHARLLTGYLGAERGIRDFRKHAGWYLAGYPVGPARRAAFSLVGSLAELDDLLAGLDPATPLPPAGRRVARGHTSGPRPVVLPERWYETADDPTPPAGADTLVSGG